VRCGRDQAPYTFCNAIQIAQIIEVAEVQNITTPPTFNSIKNRSNLAVISQETRSNNRSNNHDKLAAIIAAK
jgi:hypothetical protein